MKKARSVHRGYVSCQSIHVPLQLLIQLASYCGKTDIRTFFPASIWEFAIVRITSCCLNSYKSMLKYPYLLIPQALQRNIATTRSMNINSVAPKKQPHTEAVYIIYNSLLYTINRSTTTIRACTAPTTAPNIQNKFHTFGIAAIFWQQYKWLPNLLSRSSPQNYCAISQYCIILRMFLRDN